MSDNKMFCDIRVTRKQVRCHHLILRVFRICTPLSQNKMFQAKTDQFHTKVSTVYQIYFRHHQCVSNFSIVKQECHRTYCYRHKWYWHHKIKGVPIRNTLQCLTTRCSVTIKYGVNRWILLYEIDLFYPDTSCSVTIVCKFETPSKSVFCLLECHRAYCYQTLVRSF